MHEFHYISTAQRVIFGPGSLARVGEVVEQAGWRRVLLCTSGSQRRNGTVATLEKMLGERLVAGYERAQSHVPAAQVDEVVELAKQQGADVLLSLGGGGALGLAKAASFALEEHHGMGAPGATPFMAQPWLPTIAIPTTYAGSEMTPVYGVTRVIDGQARKQTVSDPRITPRLVIYDPELTLDLPPSVTASTGMNALAHCVEAFYSPARNPVATALALRGVGAIMAALPRCYETGDDREARGEMLVGAYLAGGALSSVTMALHHGLCHVLGGTAGVAHGIANAIILPFAMRFNRDATAPQLAPAAEVLGISRVGRSSEAMVEELIARVEQLTRQMHLPQRLREVGVREDDLPSLARLAFQNRTVQNNPRPIRDAAQLEQLLRAAW